MFSEQVKKTIEKLRAAGRVITNVYSMDVLKSSEVFISDEHAILLAHNDHGVERLYYYAHSLQDIKYLLTNLPAKEFVLEYLTKNPDECAVVLHNMGFKCIAKMMRVSAKDFLFKAQESGVSQFFNESIGVFANIKQAHEINSLLWETFDNRISHLLNNEEIEGAIKNREITVHLNEQNNIDAIQFIKIQPKKLYINHSYNKADKSVIHAMLQNRMKEFSKMGGNYVYCWVDCNNIASRKYLGKYGMQHDGMWNMVYSLKRD